MMVWVARWIGKRKRICGVVTQFTWIDAVAGGYCSREQLYPLFHAMERRGRTSRHKGHVSSFVTDSP